MLYALIAGICMIFASVLGSCLGLVLKKISHKLNDTILGFAAGIMLAAAFLGLLPSAFIKKDFFSIIIVILGVICGAFFISLIDYFVPHIHFNRNDIDQNQKVQNKTLLIVVAIAIHNIPEGLATGLVFDKGITDTSLLVSISMIFQKIPEGLIVVIPLLGMGMHKIKVFWISVLVSSMILPGLIIGILLSNLPSFLLQFFYAFTFGTIIYVISDEVIPESHEHGFERNATFALIIGILIVSIMHYI